MERTGNKVIAMATDRDPLLGAGVDLGSDDIFQPTAWRGANLWVRGTRKTCLQSGESMVFRERQPWW